MGSTRFSTSGSENTTYPTEQNRGETRRSTEDQKSLTRAARLRAVHSTRSQPPLSRRFHDDVVFVVQIVEQVPEAPLWVVHPRAIERLLQLRRRELRVALPREVRASEVSE